MGPQAFGISSVYTEFLNVNIQVILELMMCCNINKNQENVCGVPVYKDSIKMSLQFIISGRGTQWVKDWPYKQQTCANPV